MYLACHTNAASLARRPPALILTGRNHNSRRTVDYLRSAPEMATEERRGRTDALCFGLTYSLHRWAEHIHPNVCRCLYTPLGGAYTLHRLAERIHSTVRRSLYTPPLGGAYTLHRLAEPIHSTVGRSIYTPPLGGAYALLCFDGILDFNYQFYIAKISSS